MSTLSLFSSSDYMSRTKKEKAALLMSEFGDLFSTVGLSPTKHVVKIERLSDYDYDLFSFEDAINVEVEVAESFPEPQRATWTQVDVGMVHEQLIIQLLTDVRDKRVGEKTLIEWLFWVEGNEEILGKPQPFSFEACCIFWGFDPDGFRHRLTYVLRHHRGWDIRWQERKV